MSNLDFVKDDEVLAKNLDKTFALGERQFKGQKLNKFTLGHRIIINQVREEQDSTEFFIWSTLFCLVTPRNKLIELGWNKNNFRGAVLDWADNFVEQDFIEAVKIVEDVFKEISESKVTTKEGGDDPK
jgi:hypothetical protein